MNLKWNISGKGFKDPPPEYINYLKEKRAELIRLNLTTTAAVLSFTFGLAMAKGHLTADLTKWIFIYHMCG